MELLAEYNEKGDCLSKAMAEMLLKSLGKSVSDFKVSPMIHKRRENKDFHFTDHVKGTTAESRADSRAERSHGDKSGIRRMFDHTPDVEVNPFNPDVPNHSEPQELSKERRSTSQKQQATQN